VGMIMLGGLTPVAAAEEAGIETGNYAMHTVMEYQELIKFQDLLNREHSQSDNKPNERSTIK